MNLMSFYGPFNISTMQFDTTTALRNFMRQSPTGTLGMAFRPPQPDLQHWQPCLVTLTPYTEELLAIWQDGSSSWVDEIQGAWRFAALANTAGAAINVPAWPDNSEE